ncbi:hypothetical protein EV715DRAFT_214174 [Schizophyllum commune]
MYTVHSLSQEIEDLAGAPWTAEEEEVVRRVEREAFRSSSEEVKRMANEPCTEEEEAVASQVEQTALRSSSAEVEALASAPWSAEEEEAVRMVEMRAMGVQGAAIPSNDRSMDSLARRIITPSPPPRLRPPKRTRAEAIFPDELDDASAGDEAAAVLKRIKRWSSPVSATSGEASSARPQPAIAERDLARALVSSDTLVLSSQVDQTDEGDAKVRTYNPFLDVQAVHSGEETSSGEEDEGACDGGHGDQEGFLRSSPSEAAEVDSARWVGLLSQNLPDGPQFVLPPIRRGDLGGVGLLRMVKNDSGDVEDGEPSEEGEEAGDCYSIGSFVVSDCEEGSNAAT